MSREEGATAPALERGRSAITNATGRLRSSSVRIFESNMPSGMWSATATTTAQAPSLLDIRQARYIPASLPKPEHDQVLHSSTQPNDGARIDPSTEQYELEDEEATSELKMGKTFSVVQNPLKLTQSGRYPNGYKFPAKHTWQESMAIGFHAFLRFLITPFGFILTIYGLNVVAWGAMIFFLLIGAASNTMCWVQRPYGSDLYIHDCNDLYSPRRIWIEIDSQVLTALFCVTAFGLVPWRFRDLWYLLKWRTTGNERALRKLAAWHRTWYRLPGSDQLDATTNVGTHDGEYNTSALPVPIDKAPDPPLTGVRAPPTAGWKMDFVVWSMAFNTFMQVVLCYFMWAQNRFVRPSWATGVFVALGCVSAGWGGVVQFLEGRRIKNIEGIPLEVGQAVAAVAAKRRGGNADAESQV